ncbi:PREDICTED: uncharacterized protein KIAA1143 homolog isoform X1 [Cyphomyrmex costatus]|nr:PREDICTED: uncharacterized protein KIAA1143 homolog isoform X1 [Cyphomyrmex costatus]
MDLGINNGVASRGRHVKKIMSRKKHNVSYIKPNEPKFLRELKEQIGYKEGPTVDTKREVLPKVSDDEREELTDEKPVVVVLNSGDLTAEEADAFKKQKEKEENNAPADLSKKIIFRKTKAAETDSDTTVEDKPVKKKAKKEKQKIVLSFDDDNDIDEER